MFSDVAFPLVVGLLGSLHCLGMCGPLVAAYGLGSRRASGEAHGAGPVRLLGDHALFHAGRLAMYAALGAAGAWATRFLDVALLTLDLRGAVSMAGGALLVLLGLGLLGLLPMPLAWGGASAGLSGRWMSRLLSSPSMAARVGLGMATGLLPCCLSWAMVVTSAATQDPVRGGLAMLLFGAGTSPVLILVGIPASILSLRVRLLGQRLAAASVLLMGLVLVFRGATA
jgi:sulfite exporter TauE/SafE